MKALDNIKKIVIHNVLDSESYNKVYFFYLKNCKLLHSINNINTCGMVYLKLTLTSVDNDIEICLEPLSYTSQSELVNLNTSIFNENSIHLKTITQTLSVYSDNILEYLYKMIKDRNDLNNFISKIENLEVVFHQLYLEAFSKSDLEKIHDKFFHDSKNWFNIDLKYFENNSNYIKVAFNMFQAQFIDSMYFNEIEFDADSSDSSLEIFCFKEEKYLTAEELLMKLNM